MSARIASLEWRRVWIFALMLVLFTLIPYLVGWLQAGEAWTFNGFTFGTEDGNAYLGKMRIGAEGGWKFHLFYSPEQHESAFGLYLPHILVGHVVRFFVKPESAGFVTALAAAFQIWRVIASLFMILAVYRFIAVFLAVPQTRWLALILGTLGGGLGWLLVLVGKTDFLGTLPVDFYIPEGFSFLALYGLPHIATARAALLMGFVLLFIALAKNDPRYALLCGLCWNITGLMVTFYLAVLYVLLGVWGMALWIRQRRFPLRYALLGGLAAALTLPLFVYNAWLFTNNDAFAQWSRQNYLPSPHPLHYVIGYGVLAAAAIPGARLAWRRAARPGGEPFALLVAWVAAVPVLVYLPLNIQRRLAEGVLIPLVILAVMGMYSAWRQNMRERRVRVAILAVLMLSAVLFWFVNTRRRLHRRVYMAVLMPSAVLFWFVTLVGMLSPGCTRSACPFRARAEQAALNWLADYAEPDAVVMATERTGNFLPIQTDLRPFLGHGPETLYSEEKREQVEDFYTGNLSDEAREALIAQFQIRFVIFGALERELGGDPSQWNRGMSIIYDENGYIIYEVTP